MAASIHRAGRHQHHVFRIKILASHRLHVLRGHRRNSLSIVIQIVKAQVVPFDRQELFANAEIYSNLLPGPTRSELKESLNSRGEFVVTLLIPGARLVSIPKAEKPPGK